MEKLLSDHPFETILALVFALGSIVFTLVVLSGVLA